LVVLPLVNIGKVKDSSVVEVLAREDDVVKVPRVRVGDRVGFLSSASAMRRLAILP
jgi:hypothetical protein